MSAMFACYAGVELPGGESEESDEGEDEDEPQPELVEFAGVVELSSSCVALEPGERVASMSPEGDVWLTSEAGASASYRVVGRDGTTQSIELDHPTEVLQAWDTSRVSYLAEGQPWFAELDDSLTEPLFWPETLAAPTQFCGDPSIDGDGFLVAEEALVQRDAGLWWRWVTPAAEDFGPVRTLATSYGACVDRQGALWLQTETGEVWRVSADDAQIIEAFAGAELLVSDVAGVGAGAIVGGELVYGAPGQGWIQPQFADPEAEAEAEADPVAITGLAASVERLWVASSLGLLSFDGESWWQVSIDGQLADDAVPGAQLWADAETAWLVREGELCRLEQGPVLAFEGLRPLQRVVETTLSFDVFGPEAGAVEILLDGMSVAAGGGPEPWAVEGLSLGEPGWHTIEAVATAGLARTLEVELRLPTVGNWVDDIAPLAELHCAGINGCHGPEVEGQGRPVLTEYAGWVENAAAISARVGLTADMPPPANQLETWDAEEVSVILTWIEAGMPMGA